MPILSIIAGFALLIGGSEILVRGASALAIRLGLTPFVVGLTVVAVGTSSPELAVSIKASLGGTGGVALGNIVGSNICNVGLILGAAALFSPLTVERKIIRREIPILLGASVLFLVFVANGTLGSVEGTVSIAAVAGYMVFMIRESRIMFQKNRETPQDGLTSLRAESAGQFPASMQSEPADQSSSVPSAGVPSGVLPLWVCIVSVIAGLAALVFGSRFAVTGAVEVAERLGLSGAIIGLTIVALGTSLPELVTSCVAALKNEADIAVGNVIGSNLFNLLLIGGTASALRPIDSTQLGLIDFGVMLVFTILLLPFLRSGFRLSRWEGAVFVAGYIAYMVFLVVVTGR